MQIAIDPNQWLASKRSLSGVEWDIYETAYLLMASWGRPISEVELRRHLGNLGGKIKAGLDRLITLGMVTFADAVFAIKEALEANRLAGKIASANRRNALKRWETRDAMALPSHCDRISPANAGNQLKENETSDAMASASRAVIPNLLSEVLSELKNQKIDSPKPESEPASDGVPADQAPYQPSFLGAESGDPQSSIHSRKSLNKKKPEVDPPGFAEFWQAYPLRVAKGAARKAFAQAVRSASLDEIVAGARRYAAEKRADPTYIKHPATWLNKECWGDEPLAAVHTGLVINGIRLGAPL